jgi:membrane protease YdiL (CAAX protease family)
VDLPRVTPLSRPGAWLALATVVWLAGFVVLASFGTWLPLALAGPALATLAIAGDARTRDLLRPRPGRIALGIVAGLLMVGLSHGAFAAVAAWVPAARPALERLMGLSWGDGLSPAMRAGLIVLVAASEEIVFRGAVLAPASPRAAGRVLALAALYAFSMAPLRSGLLVLVAFLCGALWGALRLQTRSLVVPILAHVTWDLGVLVLWPPASTG